MYELKADLNAYLATSDASARRTLKEVIEFNERNREQEMPYFGQDLFLKAEAKGPLTEKEYLDALAKNHQLTRTEGIDALMDKHQPRRASSRPPAARPGSPTWSTATTPPAAVPTPPPSPVIPIST